MVPAAPGRHLLHGLLALLEERPRAQHQSAIHPRVDLETDLGAHRRDRAAPIHVEWVKGHATVQQVWEGTITLWQLQAKELVDEQAKKGSALHPSVAQVEQSYSARASFLGWSAKFLGRLHRKIHRLERRGACGAEAAAQAAREAGGVATRAVKEESHTHQIFAHAHACEDGQILVVLKVRVLHCTTGERTCAGRCGGIVQIRGWSTPEAQGWQEPKRRTLAGGANLACGEPGGRGPGGGDGSWMGLVQCGT